MGVYVTGDCHGDFRKLVHFIDKMKLGANDNIIVLGDMGLYWRYDKRDAQDFIDFYEANYQTTIYWIEGNHENFNLIKKLPLDIGGCFRICSPHIRMMIRGGVYIINDLKILACGGADSVDRGLRQEGLTWWADERISEETIDTIINHYKDWDFDIVISHAAPRKIVDNNKAILCELNLDENKIDHTSEDRLQQLRGNIKFKKWYFGHYHQDVHLDNKFTCLFHNFERID